MRKKPKRIVIKVGTSTLTDSRGLIDRSYITSLANEMAGIKASNIDQLLVTSGAIRAGMEKLGLTERPKTIPEKQAAAAVGQGILMQVYSEVFQKVGITTAQVLLTREDFVDRRRYLNARNTMLTLLRHGIIPIVNENDTVAVDEIRFGDNDTLSALVASSIEADLLIILSDVPGLYDADPSLQPNAKVIPIVEEITDDIRAVAGDTRGVNGTGGMKTKIEAAEIAMSCGVTMVVANGRQPGVISDIVSGKQVGTTFIPKAEPLCGRKRWIAFGVTAKGKIVVNDGAKRMICERGKSLLPVGVTDVEGDFASGDVVEVFDCNGNQFARGFVNYSADELRKILGKRTSEIENILGYKDFDEVIHRDNMVLNS
jgi:glutamate 5-kinase